MPSEPKSGAGPADSAAGEKFQRLVEIMRRLRSPGGCPWDREQNFDTIKPYLLEETYEVMDSIDAKDWRGLAEELGDLLLQAVFFAQMASEEGRFRIEDSLDHINNKLIRRHPHVFGDGSARTADDVKKRWDEIKKEEKQERGAGSGELLAGVPRTLPALVEASQIASKAAGVGFDWDTTDHVLQKLDEELGELARARARSAPDPAEIEDEIGDLLFVIVNVARFLKTDPEQALRKTNTKFRRRFGYVELKLAERGRSLKEAAIDEMETLWQEAKGGRRPRAGGKGGRRPRAGGKE